MATFEGFPADTFAFLNSLSKNNTREWFAENRLRYEQSFLEPALAFIRAMEKPLSRNAPLLTADDRKVGGSLMRIYKDTRFSKDKTPYKTNIGIHFRHAAGKDVHAPGIYLHIAPDECFLGAGIWRPPSGPLKSIREFLAENPTAWNKAMRNQRFQTQFELYEDRLRTAPRGFPKDHPLIAPLRLKSFIGLCPLEKELVTSRELLPRIEQMVKASSPLMAFLCEALHQPY